MNENKKNKPTNVFLINKLKNVFPIYDLSVNLSVSTPAYLFIFISVFQPTSLPFYLFTYLPVSISTCLPVHLFICVPVHVSTVYVSTCFLVNKLLCELVFHSISLSAYMSFYFYLFTCLPVYPYTLIPV